MQTLLLCCKTSLLKSEPILQDVGISMHMYNDTLVLLLK